MRSQGLAQKEPGMKDSGMILPVPEGSCCLKARSTSWSSSMVVGMGLPTAASQSVLR